MEIKLKSSHLKFYLAAALSIPIILIIVLILLMNPLSANSVIDPSARIGVVNLNVKDLNTVKNFYVDVVMLDIMQEDQTSVTLGKGDEAIVKLFQAQNLPARKVNDAGLYHMAIVFQSRGELAKVVNNVLQKSRSTYQGSSDHTVSEAFYFADPEGNGIEIYYDRPRNEWRYDANGNIVMGGEYIDEMVYISKYLDAGADESVMTGHIHLQVGDIDSAANFYSGVLGFEVQARMSNALFISAGGYHHHIGLNTWNSLGAARRGSTYGLRSFEILINDLSAIEDRLKASKITYTKEGNAIRVNDPWGNVIIFSIDK